MEGLSQMVGAGPPPEGKNKENVQPVLRNFIVGIFMLLMLMKKWTKEGFCVPC